MNGTACSAPFRAPGTDVQPLWLARRTGCIFAWDPGPWTPGSLALVMHRANVNAARGLHEIGDREVVRAIAHGTARGTEPPTSATTTALERVDGVNAAFAPCMAATDAPPPLAT